MTNEKIIKLEKESDELYTEHLKTITESLKRRNHIDELTKSNEFMVLTIKEMAKEDCRKISKIHFLESKILKMEARTKEAEDLLKHGNAIALVYGETDYQDRYGDFLKGEAK